MGAKATFNATTRIVKLTEAPTLIDGEYRVSINVKADLYGDQKEDWLSTPALRKLRPPISVIGGQTTPNGFAGNTFFLANDWDIELYDADQILSVDGNLYKSDGTSPFIKPSGGTYATQIDRFISNIVDTVETGVSGLTAEESTWLASVPTIEVDMAFLKYSLKGEKALEKTGSTWYLKIWDTNSPRNLILNKALKDVFDSDIDDLAAGALGKEEGSTV